MASIITQRNSHSQEFITPRDYRGAITQSNLRGMETWKMRAKAKMREKKITQEKLAETLGCTQGAVAHWLSGRRSIGIEELNKVADVLGVSRSWLTYGNDDQMVAEPSAEDYARSTEGPLSFTEIEKIIVKVISNNAKGISNAADIAQEAARKILAKGGATGSVSGQFIFASPEEIELLELFKKTNPSGRKSILNAVRGIQAGEPVAENVEIISPRRTANSK